MKSHGMMTISFHAFLSAEAYYLVTGDSDLLTLGNFREIAIVSLSDFELVFGD